MVLKDSFLRLESIGQRGWWKVHRIHPMVKHVSHFGDLFIEIQVGGFKYFLFSPLPGEMIQFD